MLERAEGNPLYLEEIARALGDASLLERIPDTVQALIAARIDRSTVDEKRVLQSAALVGRVFWRGALDRLAPDLDVAAVIDALPRRAISSSRRNGRRSPAIAPSGSSTC